MAGNYKDIIHLPHHTSKTRPRMSAYNRAAQFSPFAALTGYEDAVRETARLTDEKTELDEYQIAIINHKLNVALEKKGDKPELYITFFIPDKKKKGGEYVTVSGSVRCIDETSHSIILTDGTTIPVEYIYDIDGEIFEVMNLP